MKIKHLFISIFLIISSGLPGQDISIIPLPAEIERGELPLEPGDSVLLNSGSPDSTWFRNNYIFVEEPNLAVDPGSLTNNFYENNFYTGDLRTPGNGFKEYAGNFDRSIWYDENDVNWKKLLGFLKDKTVPLNGENISVTEIIGFDHWSCFLNNLAIIK